MSCDVDVVRRSCDYVIIKCQGDVEISSLDESVRKVKSWKLRDSRGADRRRDLVRWRKPLVKPMSQGAPS